MKKQPPEALKRCSNNYLSTLGFPLWLIRLQRNGRASLALVLFSGITVGRLQRSVLLPESPLLLAIQLVGRNSDSVSADGSGLIRPAQQHIRLIDRRVVDELPLVVGLLLVVNADRLFFA